MKLPWVAAFVVLTVCFVGSSPAQNSSAPAAETQASPRSPDDNASSSAQAEQPSAKTDKKESKIKRKAKELIPSCVGISGGAGKCRHSDDDAEQARKEAEEQQLRRQCREAAELQQQESPSCADLRKRDAAHDLEVGDTYLEQKSYAAAVSRYRSALEGDSTNATAMLHLAQALEKLGRKPEAYSAYQKYLSTNPSGSDAQDARAAADRLRGDVNGAPK